MTDGNACMNVMYAYYGRIQVTKQGNACMKVMYAYYGRIQVTKQGRNDTIGIAICESS